jgi:omega-amidase
MKNIALAQMNVEYGNFDRNIAIGENLIQGAIQAHCDWVLLPELWSSGFDLHHLKAHASRNLTLLEELQLLSDENDLSICGTYIEKQNEEYFNSFIALQPNKPRSTYHKIHLFSLMHEDKYFVPGKKSMLFTSSLGVTGLTTCFDLRFPELFLDLAARGVESFLLAAHWPVVRIQHWDVLLQARAIENQAFMMAVNSVGPSGRDVYGGHSVIIAPDGEIILQASAREEGLFCAEIDPGIVKTIRENFHLR